MVRVAICGLGNIGRVHLDNLRSLRGCAVHGVFDTLSARTAFLGEDLDIRCYASFQALLADASVDAVVIATPSNTHRELTEFALKAGKHVFVEKPLAATLEETRAVIAAANAYPSLVVQAGFCERFNPQFIEAARVVGSGAIGVVRAIHSYRVAPLALGNPSWELGVLDTAVHNLDLILWMLRDLPVRVLARGARIYGQEPALHTVTILLEFANGVLATDVITWLADSAHPLSQCARVRMNILGESGSFEVNLSNRPSALLTASTYREIDTVLLGGSGYPGCLKLQFEGFLQSIEEGAPVLASVEDAYRAEQVVLAAQLSLQQANWVVVQ